ncbi:hypothetical protein GCM10010272_32530 [Streptomyces lateritius]|nr:hypothetical protein GCM10010272_32530 [Streptomyces lateritius]
MLYVTSGAYGVPFEVIERGSCHAAPLALIRLIHTLARESTSGYGRKVGPAPPRQRPARTEAGSRSGAGAEAESGAHAHDHAEVEVAVEAETVRRRRGR